MLSVLWILLFVVALLWLTYRKSSLAVITIALGAILAAYTAFGAAAPWWKIVLWVAFAPLALLNIPPLRIRLISRPFLRVYKRMLPTMSSTEREALDAGTPFEWSMVE